MPAPKNITSPVSLHGCGRSGTTLMTSIFRSHRDFQALGETSNLIYSSYHTLQTALPFCAPEINKENAEDYARQGVSNLLLDLFPSDRARWFHKPIMTPSARTRFQNFEDFCSWYWRTSHQLFPHGFSFTILREPVEVAKSYMKRWRYTAETALNAQTMTLKLLAHPDSLIKAAIRFRDLRDNPRDTLERLFTMIDGDFDENVMNAFNQNHASNEGRLGGSDEIRVTDEIRILYEGLIDRYDIKHL